MFKVQFDIFHKKCWGSEINLKFPDVEFSSIDVRWIRNQVAHILKVTGNPYNFNNVIRYLKNRRDISKIETLSSDQTNLYLRVLTKKVKSIGQFSDIFFRHNCFPITPTLFKDKYEIWTLGTADKKNITKIYNLLRQKYKLKIKYIKEEKVKDQLTYKQREILNYAKHLGYYEWPRKKSVTAICKMLSIPKTVFLSHLRKAEIKIINNIY